MTYLQGSGWRRAAGIVTSLLISALPAVAAAINLSQPHGDAHGCENRVAQVYSEEPSMLLTATELATTMSLCSFQRIETAPDGSLKISASCAEEGEGGETPAAFTVRRGTAEGSLVIFDESGGIFGEVQRCP